MSDPFLLSKAITLGAQAALSLRPSIVRIEGPAKNLQLAQLVQGLTVMSEKSHEQPFLDEATLSITTLKKSAEVTFYGVSDKLLQAPFDLAHLAVFRRDTSILSAQTDSLSCSDSKDNRTADLPQGRHLLQSLWNSDGHKAGCTARDYDKTLARLRGSSGITPPSRLRFPQWLIMGQR